MILSCFLKSVLLHGTIPVHLYIYSTFSHDHTSNQNSKEQNCAILRSVNDTKKIDNNFLLSVNSNQFDKSNNQSHVSPGKMSVEIKHKIKVITGQQQV